MLSEVIEVFNFLKDKVFFMSLFDWFKYGDYKEISRDEAFNILFHNGG